MLSTRFRSVSLRALTIAILFGGTAAHAEGPSTVVAKQGNVSVTLEDIDAFAAGIPTQQRAGFFDSPKRVESVISNLLAKKQLAAEARQQGMDKDPAVRAQIAAAEEDALSKVRMERFKAEIKVPDLTQLAKETYVGNKAKYILPGRLDVKHILISTKSRPEAEARELADNVDKEAKASPDQFDALVEKYSDDPSKERNHGLMTNAGGEQYQPAFAEASRALRKVGEISPVVQTTFGFHIIQLVERTQDRQLSFDEARGDILRKLQAEYVEKAVRNHTDQITNRPIDANSDLVASLRSRYGEIERPASSDASGGK